jgi:hypothetical protein
VIIISSSPCSNEKLYSDLTNSLSCNFVRAIAYARATNYAEDRPIFDERSKKPLIFTCGLIVGDAADQTARRALVEFAKPYIVDSLGDPRDKADDDGFRTELFPRTPTEVDCLRSFRKWWTAYVASDAAGVQSLVAVINRSLPFAAVADVRMRERLLVDVSSGKPAEVLRVKSAVTRALRGDPGAIVALLNDRNGEKAEPLKGPMPKAVVATNISRGQLEYWRNMLRDFVRLEAWRQWTAEIDLLRTIEVALMLSADGWRSRKLHSLDVEIEKRNKEVVLAGGSMEADLTLRRLLHERALTLGDLATLRTMTVMERKLEAVPDIRGAAHVGAYEEYARARIERDLLLAKLAADGARLANIGKSPLKGGDPIVIPLVPSCYPADPTNDKCANALPGGETASPGLSPEIDDAQFVVTLERVPAAPAGRILAPDGSQLAAAGARR